MIEYTIALSLAILGLTIHNMRCIHRVEKEVLRFMYNNKEKHDLEDKWKIIKKSGPLLITA